MSLKKELPRSIQLYQHGIGVGCVLFIDPQWISAATGEWCAQKQGYEEDYMVLLGGDDWL